MVEDILEELHCRLSSAAASAKNKYDITADDDVFSCVGDEEDQYTGDDAGFADWEPRRVPKITATMRRIEASISQLEDALTLLNLRQESGRFRDSIP